MTIVGSGNPTMGDDGIGVDLAGLVREPAAAGPWPAEPEVLCAAEDPALALSCAAEGKPVLLIDAADMGLEAGDVARLFRSGLPTGPEPAGWLDARGVPCREAIQSGGRAGVPGSPSHPGRAGGRREPGSASLRPRAGARAGGAGLDQGGGEAVP